MQVIERKLKELQPYEKNPRRNDDAVKAVAESIKQFGFKVPIVIDKNDVIVCGHTRYKAARRLHLSAVPCVIADDLTDEQIKAYRLADNKVSELAEWDMDLLYGELKSLSDIDMSELGFEDLEKKQADAFFKDKEKFTENREVDEEYQEFLDKFEDKHTTDDCYTPDNIHEAVMDYVADYYKVDKTKFVRPFYPGGDYKKYNYNTDSIVVDNPPFSILSEIVNYYTENSIKFFVYGPAMTIFNKKATAVCLGTTILYENGAKIATSFLTNMEPDIAARTCPDLRQKIDEINNKNRNKGEREVPKYVYPNTICIAMQLSKYSRYGIDLKIEKAHSMYICELDEQKKEGKAIYGAGYLVGDAEAEKLAKAEKLAEAEKLAWELSDREKEIQKKLG